MCFKAFCQRGYGSKNPNFSTVHHSSNKYPETNRVKAVNDLLKSQITVTPAETSGKTVSTKKISNQLKPEVRISYSLLLLNCFFRESRTRKTYYLRSSAEEIFVSNRKVSFPDRIRVLQIQKVNLVEIICHHHRSFPIEIERGPMINN